MHVIFNCLLGGLGRRLKHGTDVHVKAHVIQLVGARIVSLLRYTERSDFKTSTQPAIRGQKPQEIYSL